MNQRWIKTRYLDLAALLLFLLPVLAYWGYCLAAQPAPHYDGIDPEYEYFLNSLSVFKHQPYSYVDHPGTPVEMIGTALLGASYPLLAGRPEGFVTYYLRNPQLFLGLADAFLVAAHLVCVLVFFRVARRWASGNSALLAAALATAYFAVQPYAFSGSVLWSHNSFSFPFGTLLLLWLCLIVTQPETRLSRLSAQWTGLGLGVGILAAITIFLSSWAVGALVTVVLYYGLLRRSWKEMLAAGLAFGLGSIVGFYVAVLPVIGKIGGFWNWIYSILSHQSNYLAVPSDQPMLLRLASNAVAFYDMLPALALASMALLALMGAALLLWRDRIQQQPALWALAGGLSVQLVALTLVFLDRPLRAYYFLGVAAIVPVLALIVLALCERAPLARSILVMAVSAAVLIGLVVNAAQGIIARRAEMRTEAESQKLVQQIITQRAREVQRPPEDLTVLWMYGTYSDCWGLWFANQRSGDAFDKEISHICPKQYELAGRVLMPNDKVPLESMDWDIVFTCERYTDTVLLKEPGAQVRLYPDINWTCGKMAAVTHR